MVHIQFSAEDLANTRFAFSPLWEAVSSYCVLTDPRKQALHLPWVREAREAVQDLDTGLLDALITYPKTQRHSHYADFLAPFPSATLPDFDHEIAALRALAPDEVRRDIQRNYGGLPQEPFRPFLEDPEGALETLADLLTRYWQRALAHHWPRLRALLEADVLYRAQILALKGPDALLDSLSQWISYKGRRLVIDKFCDQNITLTGHGLVLIPSVFSSLSMGELPWQEMLQYQVRGVALAWHSAQPAVGDALITLLGSQRAALLKRLVIPASTGELASFFEVTSGAVSQQLNWLRQAGLVSTQRRGQRVYHELSLIGRSLLESYGELDTYHDRALVAM